MGLEVHQERPIETVQTKNGVWQVADESWDAVVCCAPWPQTAKLLQLPSTSSPYAPCLTGLYEYDGEPTGLARDTYGRSNSQEEEPLAWSACENHKTGRISPGKTVFVVQASEKFSRKHFEDEQGVWLWRLRQELEMVWELSADAFSQEWGHRWKFSRRLQSVLLPPLPVGFFLTGDSLARSRIGDVLDHGKKIAADVAHFLGISP
jgi:renalase